MMTFVTNSYFYQHWIFSLLLYIGDILHFFMWPPMFLAHLLLDSSTMMVVRLILGRPFGTEPMGNLEKISLHSFNFLEHHASFNLNEEEDSIFLRCSFAMRRQLHPRWHLAALTSTLFELENTLAYQDWILFRRSKLEGM
jgi:hypothetical protein